MTMTILHSAAVAAAPRRIHALAVCETAPSAFPVIIDVFTASDHGGIQPHLTVISASADRAARLASVVETRDVSMTCRVGPETATDTTPWISVHTVESAYGQFFASGVALDHRPGKVRTGETTVRPGLIRVVAGITDRPSSDEELELKPGETAFLYTDDLNEPRPFNGAWYWPVAGGLLATAAADGFGYQDWQQKVCSILGDS